MILKNPTDKDISIQVKGEVLTVEANSTVEVTEAQGQAWLLIHSFLQVAEAPVVAAKAPAPKAEAPKVEIPVAPASLSALVPSPGALTAAPKADK